LEEKGTKITKEVFTL